MRRSPTLFSALIIGIAFCVASCNKSAPPTSVDTTKTNDSTKTTSDNMVIFRFKNATDTIRNAKVVADPTPGPSSRGIYVTSTKFSTSLAIRIWSVTKGGTYPVGDPNSGLYADIQVTSDPYGPNRIEYVSPNPGQNGGPSPAGTIDISTISSTSCIATFSTMLMSLSSQNDRPFVSGSINISK